MARGWRAMRGAKTACRREAVTTAHGNQCHTREMAAHASNAQRCNSQRQVGSNPTPSGPRHSINASSSNKRQTYAQTRRRGGSGAYGKASSGFIVGTSVAPRPAGNTPDSRRHKATSHNSDIQRKLGPEGGAGPQLLRDDRKHWTCCPFFVPLPPVPLPPHPPCSPRRRRGVPWLRIPAGNPPQRHALQPTWPSAAKP